MMARSRAGHRSLAPTPGTLPQISNGPCLPPSAAGTAETRRPPESRQVSPTCLLGAEVRLQLRQIPGVFFRHPRTLHIVGYLSQADTPLQHY
jgi:hypothetical protein